MFCPIDKGAVAGNSDNPTSPVSKNPEGLNKLEPCTPIPTL